MVEAWPYYASAEEEEQCGFLQTLMPYDATPGGHVWLVLDVEPARVAEDVAASPLILPLGVSAPGAPE